MLKSEKLRFSLSSDTYRPQHLSGSALSNGNNKSSPCNCKKKIYVKGFGKILAPKL